jgi:hypothetical protein
MVPEPADPSDLAGVILDWFRLLARGRWDEACNRFDESNFYGKRWTPASIRQTIDQAVGEGYQVTDPDAIPTPSPTYIYTFDDGSGYQVEVDVPLDGIWSDLTARFHFLRRPGGLAVVLYDLHVL